MKVSSKKFYGSSNIFCYVFWDFKYKFGRQYSKIRNGESNVVTKMFEKFNNFFMRYVILNFKILIFNLYSATRKIL